MTSDRSILPERLRTVAESLGILCPCGRFRVRRACGSCPDRHERDRSSDGVSPLFASGTQRPATDERFAPAAVAHDESFDALHQAEQSLFTAPAPVAPATPAAAARSPMRRLLHRSMLPQAPIAPMRNSRFPLLPQHTWCMRPTSLRRSPSPRRLPWLLPQLLRLSSRQCPVRAGFRCDRWQRPLVCSGTGSSRTRSSVIDPVGVRGTARGYGAERFLLWPLSPHGCGFSGTSGSGCTVLRS